jgi:predicted ATPase
MDRCLAAYRSSMHRPGAVQDPGVMCLCYSAWAQWELGYVDDALRRTQRVIALAHELDHKFSLGEAYGFASSVHLFRGETEAALECAERSIAICDEGGFALWLAHALVMRGRLRCDLGALDEGLADMQEGYTLWVATGAVVTLPMYATLRAEGLALAGRPGEGLALLAQSLALIERTGERYHEAEIRRLSGELGWQQAAPQDAAAAAAAEDWLRDAHALAQRQHKHSFVLRAANGLAQLWLARDQAAQAYEVLKAALAAMPESGDTRDALSARQMMRRAREAGTMPVGSAR